MKLIVLMAICSFPVLTLARVQRRVSPHAGNGGTMHDALSSYRSVKLPIFAGTDLRFTHVALGEGSSHSRILGVAQDHQGFLWFGTEDGLQRYDGYTFKTYRPDPGDANSLGGTLIHWLLEDRKGKLWIGAGAALDRYDPLTNGFAHFSGGVSDVDPIDGDIPDVYEDHQGMIWAASAHGLFRVDPQTAHRTRYLPRSSDPSTLSSDRVMSTFEGSDGKFWVCTSQGVDLLDRRTAKVTRHFALPVPWNAEFRVFRDHAGVLWLGYSSGAGLATLDEVTGITRYSFHKIEPDSGMLAGVNSIIEDENGTLWLGTQGSGLLKLDRDRKAFVQYLNDPSDPESLSENNVLSLFEDREGNIWVATSGGGLNRFSRRQSTFRTYRHLANKRNSLFSNFVLSTFQDRQGDLWVGTRAGLNHIDHRDASFTLFRNTGGLRNLSNTNVMATVEDSSGKLWFATWGGGLNVFDPKTSQFRFYRHDPSEPDSLSGDTVGCLYIDHNGVLWAGTDRGVDRFDPHTRKFRSYQPSERNSGQYRAIVEDSEGALWLANLQGGVQRLNPQTGEFAIYRHDLNKPRSLSSDRVNTLLISSSGTIWAGTANGLDKFDRSTQAFTSYYPHNGLPSSSVNQVLEDGHGNLWLGTSHGLSRFDVNAGTFRNYSMSDGLPANEFHYFGNASKNINGEMFFSSDGGLLRFLPDQVMDNAYVPPIVFTDFRLFGLNVEPGENSALKYSISATKRITLSHNQKIFSFEFSALSFADPVRNRYRYKLEGLENRWNETDSSRRFASYTTLSAGTYTLRVQGSNNHGLWNEQGASIVITVAPAWYETTAFRLSCLLGAFFLLWLFYYLRMKQAARALRVRFDERIAERTRIACDLHDTLLQTLQASKLVAEDAVEHRFNVEYTSHSLEKLSKWIDLATREGRAALDALHSSALDNSGLSARLQSALDEREADDASERMMNTRGTPVEMDPMISDEISRIGCEAIRNACMHSHATRIEVDLTYSEDFTLIVRDDGRGMDFKTASKGKNGHFGLQSMRERAERIHGQFQLTSAPNLGTLIELKLAGETAFGRPANKWSKLLPWLGREAKPATPSGSSCALDAFPVATRAEAGPSPPARKTRTN